MGLPTGRGAKALPLAAPRPVPTPGGCSRQCGAGLAQRGPVTLASEVGQRAGHSLPGEAAATHRASGRSGARDRRSDAGRHDRLDPGRRVIERLADRRRHDVRRHYPLCPARSQPPELTTDGLEPAPDAGIGACRSPSPIPDRALGVPALAGATLPQEMSRGRTAHEAELSGKPSFVDGRQPGTRGAVDTGARPRAVWREAGGG